MKKIHWIGPSLKDLACFTKQAKRAIGIELMRVQAGCDPMDWKPMSSIGRGVREIRVHVENEYRVLYMANIGNEIHVLHTFIKKTQKTSKKDIAIAKKRHGELINSLKQAKKKV